MKASVIVPRVLLTHIEAQRAYYLPAETGGFILGFRRSKHFEVTGVTVQQSLDVATRSTFDRCDPAHGREIERAWKRSSALVSVIGDWHSHPHGPAKPSGTDIHAWRTLMRALNLPVLGMIDAGHDRPSLFLVNKGRLWPRVTQMDDVMDEPTDIVFTSGRPSRR